MGIIFNNDLPYIEGQNLLELANDVPTPFYTYSQKIIQDSYSRLQTSLNKDIFFSVKANSNQAIIKLLYSIGAGVDVVSSEELTRVLRLNIPSSKIIFEGVGKSKYDLELAIKNNIRQINVESIDELLLITDIAKDLNIIPSVGIRINPDVDGKTLDKISTGKKTDKFGIGIEQLSEVCSILNNSKTTNFVGISCHIGSQIFEIDVFEKVFLKIKKVINFFSSNKLHVKNLDLGGGFGVGYQNNESLDLFKLNEILTKCFPNPDYNISFEPGRYILANAGFLITRILTIKKNANIDFIITDAGMHTFLRPALYNSYHKIISLTKNSKNKLYTIAGPICESSDILAKNISLPEQKRDFLLAICDVGAYGSVMASNYNSKCLPAEVLINQNNYKIIRKSQTIDELINKDIIPDW